MVTSTAQIFGSASCVQQLIISERLNQILYCGTLLERGDSYLSNDVSYKKICHLNQSLRVELR